MKGKNKMPELSTNVLRPVPAAPVTKSRAAEEKKAQQEANTVCYPFKPPSDDDTFNEGTFFADVANLAVYSLKNEQN